MPKADKLFSSSERFGAHLRYLRAERIKKMYRESFLITFSTTHSHEDVAEWHRFLNLSKALELWQCPPYPPCRTWRRSVRGSV
jgi:hypothetical protein